MKIIEINEETRAQYDAFVEAHPLGSIHQLWDWGIFQGKSGIRDKFRVVAAVEDGVPPSHRAKPKILASALVIRQRLPFGKCWLYCPRGPLGDFQNHAGREAIKIVLKKIREIARKENAIFLRFDPFLEDTFAPGVESFLHELEAVPAHAHYQPENTLILDLKHEPEKLLEKMKPKGRYNIKIAQKHGVTVRVSEPYPVGSGDHVATAARPTSVVAHARPTSVVAPARPATPGPASDLEAFYSLLRQTTARDGFSGHTLSYYRNMLQILGPKRAKLYLAEYDGKLLAGMIATYFGQTATYYFGASSNEHRNTMAPYLLHWQAIQDARAAGFHYYDFFGIAPDSAAAPENQPEPSSKLGGSSKLETPAAAPENQPDSSSKLETTHAAHAAAPSTSVAAPAPPRSSARPITPPHASLPSTPHPWAKVTEFKLKFGGERVNYLPAHEIVYNPFWFALIKIAKAINAARRIITAKFLRPARFRPPQFRPPRNKKNTSK